MKKTLSDYERKIRNKVKAGKLPRFTFARDEKGKLERNISPRLKRGKLRAGKPTLNISFTRRLLGEA